MSSSSRTLEQSAAAPGFFGFEVPGPKPLELVSSRPARYRAPSPEQGVVLMPEDRVTQ